MRVAPLPDEDAQVLARAGVPEPTDPRRPLFAETSWIRRVAGEPVVLLGGGRALLLEIAHPLVAAGVAEHSAFRRDPFARLRRTLDVLGRIVFGTHADAVAAAREVETAHARVRGHLARATARLPAGTPYDGRDPDLVRWVWATLVETAVVVYERFAGGLDEEALRAFYADQALVGRLFGVPEEILPPDWGTFQAWFDACVAGDELEVTPEAREICGALFEATAGTPQGGLARAITTALLPERLRRDFGLPWDAAREARMDALTEEVRRLRADRAPRLDRRADRG